MEQDKLDYYCDCIENAFQNMISDIDGLELTRYESLEPSGDKHYLMIICIVGVKSGHVLIEMNEIMVKRIIEGMNGEMAETDEELYFSLAEFINMVGGNGINSINNTYSGFNLRLTPPAIFTGNNMENTIIKTKSVSRSYKADNGQVRIEVGFEGV